jgi:hypothetical protein
VEAGGTEARVLCKVRSVAGSVAFERGRGVAERLEQHRDAYKLARHGLSLRRE